VPFNEHSLSVRIADTRREKQIGRHLYFHSYPLIPCAYVVGRMPPHKMVSPTGCVAPRVGYGARIVGAISDGPEPIYCEVRAGAQAHHGVRWGGRPTNGILNAPHVRVMGF
jgi:hypothetical protein